MSFFKGLAKDLSFRFLRDNAKTINIAKDSFVDRVAIIWSHVVVSRSGHENHYI